MNPRRPIKVYSEQNKGTVFHFYLPVKVLYVDTGAIKNDQSHQFVEKRTILVVDDEIVILTTSGAILTNLGFEVSTAEDGQIGLEIYKEKKDEIDLIILDMIMPKMSGSDAFREIKKIISSAKILLASGFHKDKSIDLLLEEEQTVFVNKPFNQKELIQTIKQFF